MSKTKIGLVGLASAVMGFVVQGCTAQQPPPQCDVVTSSPLYGVSEYYATTTKTGDNASADCANAPSNTLTNLTVGMTRYAPPGLPHTAVVRASYLIDVWNGDVYTGDQDPTNDCSKSTSPGKCKFCVVGTAPNLTFADGGAATETLADGGLVGIPVPGGDGGTRVVLTNACKVTEEAIARTDPNDPDGLNLNSFALIPNYPDKNGICELSQFDGGYQNFQAEPLVTGELPAITAAYNWSSFDIVNNAKAQGTFWTAKLEFVEGACKTNFDVVGFWPLVSCATLDDQGNPLTDMNGDFVPNQSACDPNADVDAGRVFGSGINPFFKPNCSAKLGTCVPTVTTADLQKAD